MNDISSITVSSNPFTQCLWQASDFSFSLPGTMNNISLPRFYAKNSDWDSFLFTDHEAGVVGGGGNVLVEMREEGGEAVSSLCLDVLHP